MRDIDAELQKMWNSVESDDPNHFQKIPRDVTDRLNEKLKILTEMTTDQIASWIVERCQKVERHEAQIADEDVRWLELAKSWSTSVGNVSAFLRNVTSRK